METIGREMRRAVPGDSAEIIRLRRVLLDGSNAYYASSDPEEHRFWEQQFVRWLAEASGSPTIFVGVVDGADSILVACGIAIIDVRPPGPGIVNGRTGWIQSMVTDPRYRGQGHASAVLLQLLNWLRHSDVHRATLQSTGMGQGLYLHHGFEPCGEDAFVIQLNETLASDN